MNHLNSVLIEGSVVCDPKPTHFDLGTDQKLAPGFMLKIASSRFYKNGAGEERKEVTYMHVALAGSCVGKICKEPVSKGAALRVIGRLALIADTVVVMCEDLEVMRKG